MGFPKLTASRRRQEIRLQVPEELLRDREIAANCEYKILKRYFLQQPATVIETIRERPGVSRELRCKYRKSCYETLKEEADKPEKLEQIPKQEKKVK